MHAIEHRPERVLDITLKGTVTKQDYDTIFPTLQSELNGGAVDGVLWDMSHMEKIEPRAVWENVKFDLQHRNSFERVAIVGDKPWHEWATKLFKPLTNADVRYFERGERTAAGEWVGAID